jgi:hypothetical protein
MKVNNFLSLLKSLLGISREATHSVSIIVCVSLLTCALAANLYGQSTPQQRIINEALINSPVTKSAVIAYDGFLLGASINGQWVDARQLQESPQYATYKVTKGQLFNIYEVNRFAGTGAAGDVETGDSKFSAMNVRRRFEVNKSNGNGTAAHQGDLRLRFANETKWEPVPRQATAMNTQNATYQSITKNYIAVKGVTATVAASPQIEQIYRVDLDGDGADEVIIYAQNLVTASDYARWWSGGLSDDEKGIITDQANSKTNLYATLFIRKIVNGKVIESPICEVFEAQGAFSLQRIVQFADLDGDGVMEIIFATTCYDEISYSVVKMEKDGSMIYVLNSDVFEE